MANFSLQKIYRHLPSKLVKNTKNLVLHMFANKEENEMQSFFTEAFNNMEVSALNSLLDNGYECTELQKSIILNEVTSVLDRLFKLSHSELTNESYLWSHYSAKTLELKITKQELFCLHLSFNYNIIDQNIVTQLMIPNLKKLEKIFLNSSKEPVLNFVFPLEQKDFSNKYFDFIFQKFSNTHYTNKNKELEAKKFFFKNINSFYNDNDTNFPFLFEHLLECPLNISADVKSKYSYTFSTHDRDLLYFTEPNDTQKVELDKYKNLIAENKIYLDFFTNLFQNYLYRHISQHDNAEKIAQIALDSKSPLLYANIVNFSHFHPDLSKITISKDNLNTLDNICSTLILKSQKSNLYNYDYKVKNNYQLIGHLSKIFIEKNLNNSETNVIKKMQQTEKLSSFVNQLQDEKNNIQNISISDIIESSLLNSTSKSHLQEIIKTVQNLGKITDLNTEEKNFLEGLESKVFNILQLQYSFNLDTPEENQKYNNNVIEQSEIILDTIISIRDNYQKRQLNSINEQVKDLIQNQNKHIMAR